MALTLKVLCIEAEFAVAFAHCNRKTGRLERLEAGLAPLARQAAALTGLR